MSTQGRYTVSLVGSIHSFGLNCTTLYEDPAAPSRIHTYRCSGQVSSQETSDMNPASAWLSQWTYAFAFVAAYEPIYHELWM